ncbi:MAG: universal stress protein, partial [Verrucomicrobia bacterium]|nr:universal stress protein [Verrucomicrobiota bacterium]
MRIKPTAKPGRVVVELSPREESLLTGGAREGVPAADFSLKTILVPTDFSSCAHKALQYAVSFARQFGARLVLLHVTPVNYPAAGELGMLDLPALERDLRQGTERELADLAHREVPEAVAVQTVVRTGRAAQEIVEAAQECEADLVVIATHGRTG